MIDMQIVIRHNYTYAAKHRRDASGRLHLGEPAGKITKEHSQGPGARNYMAWTASECNAPMQVTK